MARLSGAAPLPGTARSTYWPASNRSGSSSSSTSRRTPAATSSIEATRAVNRPAVGAAVARASNRSSHGPAARVEHSSRAPARRAAGGSDCTRPATSAVAPATSVARHEPQLPERHWWGRATPAARAASRIVAPSATGTVTGTPSPTRIVTSAVIRPPPLPLPPRTRWPQLALRSPPALANRGRGYRASPPFRVAKPTDFEGFAT